MSRKRHNIPPELKGLKTLKGLKIGMLKILELSHKTEKYVKYWKCLCDCGKEHLANDANLKRGMILSCGCNHYKKGDKILAIVDIKLFLVKKWSGMKAGAVRRNLSFKITQEYIWELLLKQDYKCAISGISISFEDKTASIDRINSKEEYSEKKCSYCS